jgi:hypothetical protein
MELSNESVPATCLELFQHSRADVHYCTNFPEILMSSKKQKKRAAIPKLHRMKRKVRLVACRKWLATQKNRPPAEIARAYRTRYSVDWESAITELTRLGIAFDPEWVDQLRKSIQAELAARKMRKAARQRRSEYGGFGGSDENFAFIVDYTEGGAPYGITWEEYEANPF